MEKGGSCETAPSHPKLGWELAPAEDKRVISRWEPGLEVGGRVIPLSWKPISSQ